MVTNKLTPFDKFGEWPAIVCSTCKKTIWNSPYPIYWPEHSQLNSPQAMSVIGHKIAKHICTEALPNFKIGSHVINIMNGHLFQIENEDDLETITTGFKNGNRSIQLYI